MGGFCPLVELHREGSAPAACAAGLFYGSDLNRFMNSGFDENTKSNLKLYPSCITECAWKLKRIGMNSQQNLNENKT